MQRHMRNLHLLPLLLLLTACVPEMDHAQIQSEEHFIVEMIPHHQEAIDSSKLMLDSEDPRVVELATNIIAAQEKEVAQLQAWRQEWYPNSKLHSSYKSMMPSIEDLEGKERDRAYLQGMIEHHRGAIKMAEQIQDVDMHPELRPLTLSVFTEQQKEIGMMEAMLR
jgi:uncharacterized protein (DUF305 family)